MVYLDLFYDTIHEYEQELESDSAHVNNPASKTEEESEELQSDLCDTPQPTKAHCQFAKPAMSLLESVSRLGGLNNSTTKNSSNPNQGELNLKTHQERRKMMADSKHVAAFIKTSKLTSWAPNSLMKLKRLMSRPAGCAFLESSATTSKIWLGEYGKNLQILVADSGSDITLISQKVLNEMENPPRIKTGQKINLIQVTGTSKISGYVTVPIFFDTDSGPVQLEIEAYVVMGMTTPIILGNDFADQYSISLSERVRIIT